MDENLRKEYEKLAKEPNFKHLKSDVVRSLNMWIKDLSTVLEDNCQRYVLYRCKLFSNENDNVCASFVASNEDGNYVSTTLEYERESGELYYDRNKNPDFINEEAVKNSIQGFISHLESLKIPVGSVYFDLNTVNPIVRGFIQDDMSEDGAYILYLSDESCTAECTYAHPDAITTGRFDSRICENWTITARKIKLAKSALGIS